MNKSPKNIAIRPLSGSIGAAVTGMNLSELNADQFSTLHEAFLDNCMLVFPAQHLGVDDFVAFSDWWGEIVTTSFLQYLEGHHGVSKLFNRGKAGSVTENWHSDTPFLPKPPSINFLSAFDVPIGGDTMWSNQYLAYESLSPGMQEMLSGLRIEFNGESLAGLINSQEELRNFHPVVRTHPETGRKCLYIGDQAQRFDGMTAEESKPLIDYLMTYIQRPEFTCRVRWEPGSLVLWDNRCTCHYAIADYAGHTRRMHRVIIAGDAPI